MLADRTKLDEMASRLRLAGDRALNITGSRDRLSDLTERLDNAATAILETKDRQSIEAAGKLAAAVVAKAEKAANSLDGLTARLDQTRAGISKSITASSSGLASHGSRMTRALERTVRKSSRRLDDTGARLEALYPSRTAIAVMHGKAIAEWVWFRARALTTTIADLADVASQKSIALAADMIMAADRGIEKIVDRLRERAAERRIPSPSQHVDAEEREPDERQPVTAEREEAHRAFALRSLESFAQGAYLPVRRDGKTISLDVGALPKHLQTLAGPVADHADVLELLERDEGLREVEIIKLLSNSPEPLVTRDSKGVLLVDVERFPSYLREHIRAMLTQNPRLQDYARAMVERLASQEFGGSATEIDADYQTGLPPARKHAHHEPEAQVDHFERDREFLRRSSGKGK